MSNSKNKNFYNLYSYLDLHKKCIYELQVIESSINDSLLLSYNLFNLVCTLNHMFDWCIGDDSIDETLRKECLTQFNPWRDEPKDKEIKKLYNKIENKTTNFNQYLIREICNKAKHFKNNPILINDMCYSVAMGNFQMGELQMGEFVYKFIVEKDDKEYDILETCRELISEWNDFIVQNHCGYPIIKY